MITTQQLEIMSHQEIETIDQTELVDLSTVHVRHDSSEVEKLMDFLEQIKNPYCFLCRDIPVRICFTDDGDVLEQTLEKYFIRIKQS